MNSQSNEYPSIIQKLDKNTFAFNYNVQEQVNENNEVYYTYEQTIINDRDLTHNKILRDTINEDLQKLKEDGTFDALAEKYGLSDMTCLE